MIFYVIIGLSNLVNKHLSISMKVLGRSRGE